jgi:hypothetical protein
MILDENDILEHVTVGVPEPDEEEQKTKHKKNEKKAKRIISRLADQHKRLIVDEEEALTTQNNKRSSFRKNNKEANSVRVPDKKRDVSNIRCYNCQKLGHFSYDCPQGKGKRKHQAHVAEEEESPPSKKALAEIKDYVL